jgi:hypothetical protein
MRPLADNPVPPTELEVLGDAINEFAFACVNHSFKWVSAEIGEYIYSLSHCNVVGSRWQSGSALSS